MDTTTVYSSKAAHYARYRWRYARQAIQTLIDVAQVGATSVIADVGAGTGILCRQLVGRPGEPSPQRVYAIEPNDEMRRIFKVKMMHLSF